MKVNRGVIKGMNKDFIAQRKDTKGSMVKLH